MTKKQKQKASKLVQELQELCPASIILADYNNGCAFAVKGHKIDLIKLVAMAVAKDEDFIEIFSDALIFAKMKNVLPEMRKAIEKEGGLDEPTIPGKN